MTTEPGPADGRPDPSLNAIMSERRQLINLAYRLLGSLADSEDESALRRLIENHQRYTGSKRAAEILAAWAQHRAKFVKVFPKEYRRALAELGQKKVAA